MLLKTLGAIAILFFVCYWLPCSRAGAITQFQTVVSVLDSYWHLVSPRCGAPRLFSVFDTSAVRM